MKKKTTILSSLLLIGAIVFTSCGGGETTKNTENKTTGNNITGTFTDSRDGKTYKTVKIGQQVWMSENLNFELKDSSCCYKNDPPNCNKYGRLYKWKTALKICPSGWHLPSYAEWTKLTNYLLGENKNAPEKMKTTSGWTDDHGKLCNGTNSSGFSALPGGAGDEGTFYNIGNCGFWWTSTQFESAHVVSQSICFDDSCLMILPTIKNESFSVRCVKN